MEILSSIRPFYDMPLSKGMIDSFEGVLGYELDLSKLKLAGTFVYINQETAKLFLQLLDCLANVQVDLVINNIRNK